MQKDSKLEDIINSEGIVITSDLHGNYDILENFLDYSQKNNYALAINGDVVDDYGFVETANSIGYKTYSQLELEYVSNLGDREKQLYQFYLLRNQIDSQGIENILQSVDQQNVEGAKKELEMIVEETSKEEFKNYILDIKKNFQEEKSEEIKENILGLRALYQVVMDEHAKELASRLNNYSDVKVLFNHGNHENSYFATMVKGYLKNPGQLVDLNESEGYQRIVNSQGEEIKLAGTTNCLQTMPYLNEIFSPEDISNLYYHMNLDSLSNNDLISMGEISEEDLENLSYKQDREYQRIKQGEESSLDILLTHGQIGTPYLSKDRKGSNVPYLTSAAALGLESKLIVEGHIHNKYEGENDLGVYTLRPVGNEASVIYKDKDGQINNEWLQVSDNYDVNLQGNLPYSKEYLTKRVNEFLSEMYNLNNQKETEFID